MKTPYRQFSIITLPVLAFLAFVCLGAIQPQDIARLPSVTNAFGDDLVVVLNGRSEAAKMTVKQISDYAAAHGGGGQTPWTSDINANGFGLTGGNDLASVSVHASSLVNVGNGAISLSSDGSAIFAGSGATINGDGVISGARYETTDETAHSSFIGGAYFNLGATYSFEASGDIVARDIAVNAVNVGAGSAVINTDGSIQINSQTTLGVDGGASFFSGSVTVTTPGIVNGNGSGLTNLNASNLASGTIPISQLPGTTNFTKYAAGTAYTLTGTSAALTFGTTQPVLTINQAGTYLIMGNVGIKYSGATYTVAQTATLKFRRTNNTAADLANGSRTTEMPVLTTFTGGDVFSMPPVVYTAANGDTVTIFGALSATPAAGSVLTDSAELVAIRLY